MLESNLALLLLDFLISACRITRFGLHDGQPEAVRLIDATNILSEGALSSCLVLFSPLCCVVKEIEAELKLPDDFLPNRPDWPNDGIAAIAASVKSVSNLANAVAQAEKFAGLPSILVFSLHSAWQRTRALTGLSWIPQLSSVLSTLSFKLFEMRPLACMKAAKLL